MRENKRSELNLSKKIVKKILISLGFSLILGFPSLVLAQGYLNQAINNGRDLLDEIVILLISFGIVWLIWNIVRYVMSSDEANKEKAKNQMIWGIVALTVIVSIWGIIGVLQNIFDVNSNQGAPDNLGNMIPGSATRATTNDNELDQLESFLY